MTELPATWQEVEITEVLAPNDNGKPFQQGWSPQCERFPAPEGTWGVLKTTAIQHGAFRPYENKALPDHLSPRPQIEVKAGDVVMTCAGPRNRCGVACLVERTRSRLMLSGKMYRFRAHPDGLEPKYLAYLIQRRETQLEIDRMKTGINDSGLNLTHDRFAALRVPLAPHREQLRIVAKIEELLSELDKAVESLTQAQAQLKTYRQALLKAAFEGKLTADWRAANLDKLEPPEALRVRIRVEREARYNEALARWCKAVKKWEVRGEVGRKPTKPRPFIVDLSAVADGDGSTGKLPVGWAWLRLHELCDESPKNGLYKPASEYGEGTQIVRIDDFYDGSLVRRAGFKKVSLTSEEDADYAIATNEILVNRVNSIEYLGKCALIPTLDAAAVFESNIMRLRPAGAAVRADWLTRYLSSAAGQDCIRENAKHAVNQASINQNDLGLVLVPYCPTEEQGEIVAVLDGILSTVETTNREIGDALRRVGALRQSILKKAFSGQLIPQDSTDEPAAALLARLCKDAPPPRTRGRKTA